MAYGGSYAGLTGLERCGKRRAGAGGVPLEDGCGRIVRRDYIYAAITDRLHGGRLGRHSLRLQASPKLDERPCERLYAKTKID